MLKHFEFRRNSFDNVSMAFSCSIPDCDPKGVIIIVHGVKEHSGRYMNLAAHLCHSGYAAINYDLRGYGKSRGRRGDAPSYDALLNDVSLALEEAKWRFPGKPVFLFGHSAGGNMVLNYALRREHTLAGVIVSSPWLKLSMKVPAYKLLIVKALGNIIPAMSLPDGILTEDLSRNAEIKRCYDEDPLIHHRMTLRFYMTMTKAAEWALEHAGDFPVPLLLMHGSEDRITAIEGSREFAEKVRGDCTFKVWNGLFHEIINEPEQEEIYAYIVNWLRHHPHR